MEMQDIIKEIQKIGQGRWVRVTEVAEKLDATPEQIGEAVRSLMLSEPIFEIMPESNRKALTRMDHLYAVRWAGDDNHLMKWI